MNPLRLHGWTKNTAFETHASQPFIDSGVVYMNGWLDSANNPSNRVRISTEHFNSASMLCAVVGK